MEWRAGRVKLSNVSLPPATTGDVYNMSRCQNTVEYCFKCMCICVGCVGVSVLRVCMYLFVQMSYYYFYVCHHTHLYVQSFPLCVL